VKVKRNHCVESRPRPNILLKLKRVFSQDISAHGVRGVEKRQLCNDGFLTTFNEVENQSSVLCYEGTEPSQGYKKIPEKSYLNDEDAR